MLQKIKQKLRDKKGASTLEFVLCMLIFVVVTAFIVDVFMISYKHYVVSANCTKAVRVIAIQGGLSNDTPDNYPGGNPNYMNNKEFRSYLNELANTVQNDVGSMNVYLGYSYIDNYDNIINIEDILVYTMSHDNTGLISTTYFPQNFLLPYGSFVTLKIEYTYKFFFTDIWYEEDTFFNFNSSKSSVTEYVSYDFSYHVDGVPIISIVQSLPPIDTDIGGNSGATPIKYFECVGNTITGFSEEGKNARITDLVIPTEINGNTITQIGEGAFAGCNTIISVTIPSNVKIIRSGAFANCSRLTSVKYYEGLERIDEYAFKSCANLKLFAPAYPYQDANEQVGIATPPRLIFPESLEELHNNAFEGCSQIKIVRFGTKIVKVGNNAFNGTDVEYVYLEKEPDTVLGAPWRNYVASSNVTVTWYSPRTKG